MIAVHLRQIGKLPIRIALPHLQLALDDHVLATILRRRDRRRQHPAGDQVDRLFHMFFGGVDEERGVIVEGVSVGIVSDLLEQIAILLFGSPRVRSARHQVLQQVRQPAAQPSALERAAGVAVGAHRENGRIDVL